MKKIVIVALLLCSGVAFAQRSSVQQLKMHSEILGAEKELTVYLPAGYEKSGERYPVLYLLHGAWGCHTDWTEKGNAKLIADEAIAGGMALPMIIVMPDAKGEGPDLAGKNMGYFNLSGWAYEDYFFKELIPHIDKTFRTKAEKGSRAIAGLSMGGGGTTIYAQRHPEYFSSACALSALVAEPNSGTASRLGADFAEAGRKVNPTLFIKNATEAQLAALRSVRWYFDCGDDDYLIAGNLELFLLMSEKKVPMELRVRNGGHNWVYWQTALTPVLQFISTGFAGNL